VLAGCDRHPRCGQLGAGPRPGPHAARLTRPSAAAVSGPVLSAPYPREEDPPPRRPGRRARDALAARAAGDGRSQGRISRGKVHQHVALRRHVRHQCHRGRGRGRRPRGDGQAYRCSPGLRCGPSRPQRARARAADTGRGAPQRRRRSRRGWPGPAPARRGGAAGLSIRPPSAPPAAADGRWQTPGGGPCRRCHATGSHSRRRQSQTHRGATRSRVPNIRAWRSGCPRMARARRCLSSGRSSGRRGTLVAAEGVPARGGNACITGPSPQPDEACACGRGVRRRAGVRISCRTRPKLTRSSTSLRGKIAPGDIHLTGVETEAASQRSARAGPRPGGSGWAGDRCRAAAVACCAASW
jgi:hypothetical protein